MNCYNCGGELTLKNKTREHIPAKNLFNGYPDEYKLNRIVVPACFDCNNQYSQIDQEIRDVIGILNNNNELQKEVTRQAVKSIMRKSNWVNRVGMGEELQNISVSFKYDDLRELHLKNFKGIFFYNYNFPLPQNFNLEIIAEGDDADERFVEIKKMIQNYLLDKDWKVSGHGDVFKYKIAMLNLKEESDDFDFSETSNIEDCDLIICEIFYHNIINPIIFAAENKYLNDVADEKKLA
ncbi:hypothetical protein P2W68_12820 [Chryseobacterium arthrosphaerae]|uniref:hypothetical protein n=1 Tax=Chryseobacterium arthrosphaerae TaxID=651561 RepID=UPI0023E1314F|nr:hypothetical protein [Chryseobacterium arthrosphaerae]WES95741.1 hypothetical protein P2W68_12820 [Chryseobacterium arthrosphaerae]